MTETENQNIVFIPERQGKIKRPRLLPTSQTSESDLPLLQRIQERLPHVHSLPNNWKRDMEVQVFQKYFDESVRPNVFVFISIIKTTGNNNNYAAIETLKDAGAFSSAKSRKALIEIIQDARNADSYRLDCADDLLDLVERYAKYAFAIEEDGLTVGCGMLRNE
jgi:hypothetical protein